MRILVGIPVLYNGTTCLKAFESVIDEADLLIIDNGSAPDVKQAIKTFQDKYICSVIGFEKNIFVNASWNCILREFIGSDFDQLVIMNSDLIMQPGWSKQLEDGIISLPCDGTLKADEEVFRGSPGIFIQTNKKMAEMVYPIPEQIKLWYGDEYILTILREMGYKTIVKHKLVGLHFHGGSQSIAILPNKSEMIEADKVAWETIVEPLMQKKISELKKHYHVSIR